LFDLLKKYLASFEYELDVADFFKKKRKKKAKIVGDLINLMDDPYKYLNFSEN